MATFNELLVGLENVFDIKATQNVVDNSVGLGLDDGSVVNIEQFPEGEMVHLHCDLGSIPEDVRPLMLMSLMATHTCGVITQGCFFGFEPQKETLILFRSLPLRGLPVDIFVEITGHFVQQVKHWRAALPELYAETRQQLKTPDAPAGEAANAAAQGVIKV